jgi:hypothetical protein
MGCSAPVRSEEKQTERMGEHVRGSRFEWISPRPVRGSAPRTDTSNVRVISLRAVNTYYWSTRALAWGIDEGTGEEVTFTMSPRSAPDLGAELERGTHPLLEVHELDVLFVGPAGVPPVTALGADRRSPA